MKQPEFVVAEPQRLHTPSAGALRDATVLLIEERAFFGDYVRHVLVDAGAAVVGPFSCAAHGLAGLNSREVALAYIGLDFDRDSELLGELRRRGVRLLVTRPPSWLPDEEEEADQACLCRPFAAFQVVQALAALALSSAARPL